MKLTDEEKKFVEEMLDQGYLESTMAIIIYVARETRADMSLVASVFVEIHQAIANHVMEDPQ